MATASPRNERHPSHTATDGAIEFATLDGGVVVLGADRIGALEATLANPLLLPGHMEWEDTIRVWNGMVQRAPSAVVRAVSARDVAAAVTFAAEHGLLLGVKAGGHNIAGTAIPERGLCIDLSLMRDVQVDAEEHLARAGGGCRLGDLDRATQAHGLATVLGFVSVVGVGGLTLGGGLGYLSRRFGWTVDNLEEVEIVTADGRIRTASRERHPDLFWAVRGGGGNFGVVTRFTFRVHPVGPTVFGGLIAWPFARADEILAAYHDITARAPREISVWLMLLRAPAAPFVPEAWHGERVCGMAVCYTGDVRQAEAAVAPIRALGDPVIDLLHPQPYTQMQSYLDATEPAGMHYYWRTGYAVELSRPLLTTVRELFAECPMPEGDIGILHLEGALNERDAEDGAVGNRDARYVIGIKGMWPPDEPRADAFRQWVRAAGDRIRPFTTGATYINFQGADENDAGTRRSYGANFERLVELKRAWDPDNLFRVNRNLVAAEADRSDV